MKKNKRIGKMLELVMHSIFLVLGLITVGCVLLITVYLVISGIPAIRRIGLVPFLFNKTWASTAATPSFGILPFILTSIYGTAGAISLGVPVGSFTAVYLAKMAKPSVRAIMQSAVSMLSGIPSVVYGLVGMLILVPGIRRLFNVPDGSSLLAAIIVLSIMILPSIIKVSVTALEAVPKEYEDASLALGATPVETYFRVSVPAAKSGIAAAVVLGVGRAIGEAMAVMMVSGNVPNMPSLFQSVRFLTTAVASEMSYSSGLQKQALFGLWMRYDGGNAQRVLAGEIENLAGGMGASLVLAVPDEACEQEVRAQVSDCYRARREQKNTPALLADFYTAIAEIDCVISVESCLLGICSDGTIFTEKGRNPHFSVSNISLEDILMCTMPRVTYDAAQQPEGENK